MRTAPARALEILTLDARVVNAVLPMDATLATGVTCSPPNDGELPRRIANAPAPAALIALLARQP
jgi:hypothetical protein